MKTQAIKIDGLNGVRLTDKPAEAIQPPVDLSLMIGVGFPPAIEAKLKERMPARKRTAVEYIVRNSPAIQTMVAQSKASASPRTPVLIADRNVYQMATAIFGCSSAGDLAIPKNAAPELIEPMAYLENHRATLQAMLSEKEWQDLQTWIAGAAERGGNPGTTSDLFRLIFPAVELYEREHARSPQTGSVWYEDLDHIRHRTSLKLSGSDTPLFGEPIHANDEFPGLSFSKRHFWRPDYPYATDEPPPGIRQSCVANDALLVTKSEAAIDLLKKAIYNYARLSMTDGYAAMLDIVEDKINRANHSIKKREQALRKAQAMPKSFDSDRSIITIQDRLEVESQYVVRLLGKRTELKYLQAKAHESQKFTPNPYDLARVFGNTRTVFGESTSAATTLIKQPALDTAVIKASGPEIFNPKVEKFDYTYAYHLSLIQLGSRYDAELNACSQRLAEHIKNDLTTPPSSASAKSTHPKLRSLMSCFRPPATLAQSEPERVKPENLAQILNQLSSATYWLNLAPYAFEISRQTTKNRSETLTGPVKKMSAENVNGTRCTFEKIAQHFESLPIGYQKSLAESPVFQDWCLAAHARQFNQFQQLQSDGGWHPKPGQN